MTPTIFEPCLPEWHAGRLTSSSKPYKAIHFLIQGKVRLGRNIKVGGVIAGCLLRRLGR
jgi:hypothetical protein